MHQNCTQPDGPPQFYPSAMPFNSFLLQLCIESNVKIAFLLDTLLWHSWDLMLIWREPIFAASLGQRHSISTIDPLQPCAIASLADPCASISTFATTLTVCSFFPSCFVFTGTIHGQRIKSRVYRDK